MNAAPEHSYLDRKIQRAYDRMMLANTRRWAYAWGDVLYRYVMKKGRAPLVVRDQTSGVRRVAESSVVPTLDKHPTTSLVDRATH